MADGCGLDALAEALASIRPGPCDDPCPHWCRCAAGEACTAFAKYIKGERWQAAERSPSVEQFEAIYDPARIGKRRRVAPEPTPPTAAPLPASSPPGRPVLTLPRGVRIKRRLALEERYPRAILAARLGPEAA
jgi:hypothetical protein